MVPAPVFTIYSENLKTFSDAVRMGHCSFCHARINKRSNALKRSKSLVKNLVLGRVFFPNLLSSKSGQAFYIYQDFDQSER